MLHTEAYNDKTELYTIWTKRCVPKGLGRPLNVQVACDTGFVARTHQSTKIKDHLRTYVVCVMTQSCIHWFSYIKY